MYQPTHLKLYSTVAGQISIMSILCHLFVWFLFRTHVLFQHGKNLQLFAHKLDYINYCKPLIIVFIVCVAERIPALYEAAVKQFPTNEEFHTHHFMAYVRVGEHKKQQQARHC